VSPSKSRQTRSVDANEILTRVGYSSDDFVDKVELDYLTNEILVRLTEQQQWKDGSQEGDIYHTLEGT
jgi:hypothetical protein